jgi:crotonobetainyl-CoA:carnitine CoA-transferase CaiB-like acyl-CoA transferase
MRFFCTTHAGSTHRAQSLPRNVLAACASPRSCHATTVDAASPPFGSQYMPFRGQKVLVAGANLQGPGQDIQIVNAGIRFGSDRPHVDEPPPRSGEHGASILQELGFTEAERKAILG